MDDDARIALPPTTRRLRRGVLSLVLTALAAVAGLAPMVHLTSASLAPIVQEDAALRTPRPVAGPARRARRHARRAPLPRRRPLAALRRALRVAPPGPAVARPTRAPRSPILRL